MPPFFRPRFEIVQGDGRHIPAIFKSDISGERFGQFHVEPRLETQVDDPILQTFRSRDPLTRDQVGLRDFRMMDFEHIPRGGYIGIGARLNRHANNASTFLFPSNPELFQVVNDLSTDCASEILLLDDSMS